MLLKELLHSLFENFSALDWVNFLQIITSSSRIYIRASPRTPFKISIHFLVILKERSDWTLISRFFAWNDIIRRERPSTPRVGSCVFVWPSQPTLQLHRSAPTVSVDYLLGLTNNPKQNRWLSTSENHLFFDVEDLMLTACRVRAGADTAAPLRRADYWPDAVR